MNTPTRRHNLIRLQALIKTDQLAEMAELAERHNRSFAGEIRHAIDYYLAANRRRAPQQEARPG